MNKSIQIKFKLQNKKLIIPVLIITLFIFSCKKNDLERKVFITTQIENQNGFSKLSANIVDAGDKQISEYGFCWSESNEPTVADNVFVISGSMNTADDNLKYEKILSNLILGKTYYYRAYTKENNQVVYGNTVVLTPNVSTDFTPLFDSVTYLTSTCLKLYGKTLNANGLKLQDAGFCFSDTDTPTISDNPSSFGVVLNDSSFNAIINNLLAGKTYNVRTFGKFSDSDIRYSAVAQVQIPELTVVTDTFAIINSTQVALKGTITILPLENVLDHGFCWSTTTSTPNYNSNKVSLGATNQTGQYLYSLNGIVAGTTYYFRAYATNGTKVYYGEVKQFKTN